MALIRCGECGNELSDQAAACPRCGRPTQVASKLEPRERVGAVLAIIGGVALAVGPFLPWATLGILTASGLERTGSEALLLVGAGLFGLLPPIFTLVRRKATVGVVSFLLALLAGLLTFRYFTQLRQSFGEAQEQGLEPHIGAGIYLCFLGALLMAVGNLMSVRMARSR